VNRPGEKPKRRQANRARKRLALVVTTDWTLTEDMAIRQYAIDLSVFSLRLLRVDQEEDLGKLVNLYIKENDVQVSKGDLVLYWDSIKMRSEVVFMIDKRKTH
jgi:hypothetical protein